MNSQPTSFLMVEFICAGKTHRRQIAGKIVGFMRG